MDKPTGHWNVEMSQRQLRDDLNHLAGDARRLLRRTRLVQELRVACGTAPLFLFVLPLLLLMVQLALALSGAQLMPLTVWPVLGLAMLGPVAYILGRLGMMYYRYHPRRASALALYDAELKTQDRLVTADEFLAEPAVSVTPDSYSDGFKLAAVADGERYARSAIDVALTFKSTAVWRIKPAGWGGAVAAAVVIAILFVGFGPRTGAHANERTAIAALHGVLAPDATKEQRVAARQLQRRIREQSGERQMPAAEEPAGEKNKQQPPNDKGIEGQSNTGSAAVAQSSNTSSSAVGDPTNQKNASKPRKPEEQKPDDARTADAKTHPKKQPEQKIAQLAVESTSGQGKTTMSMSNPVLFDIPEVQDNADAGLKHEGSDEDAEDEDEQEKANAANKPSLKDKKAPVDRNLSPMPGINCFSKEKNGRSGPGSLKKTRGVPAMILGVPVPDRLQGMSNPGRSKVTQEDAKPKEEAHAALEAQARMARSEAMGRLAHPRLMPWMQDLVKEYFMTMRGDTARPSSEE